LRGIKNIQEWDPNFVAHLYLVLLDTVNYLNNGSGTNVAPHHANDLR